MPTPDDIPHHPGCALCALRELQGRRRSGGSGVPSLVGGGFDWVDVRDVAAGRAAPAIR